MLKGILKRLKWLGFIILVMGVMNVVSFVGVLSTMKPAMKPETYAKMLEYFGLGMQESWQTNSSLTANDAAAVKAKGLDPKAVAYANEASDWAMSQGVNIGPPILLSLYANESDYGENNGDADGITAAMANQNLNAEEEKSSALKLLTLWKKSDIRSKNPLAKKLVYADYTGYIGHRSAGEIDGGGFIPSTAWRLCQDMQDKTEDPLVKSCDLFHQKVIMFFETRLLIQMGYSDDLSTEEKVNKLVGWNQLRSYREKLVATAEEINSLGVDYNFRLQSNFATTNIGLEGLGLSLLQQIGLMPEVEIASVGSETGNSLSPTDNLPSAGSGSSSEGIVIDPNKEAPSDGQNTNVIMWTKFNQELVIPAGGEWDFCTQTDQTGWDQYLFAGKVNAGGICINASMVKDWAESTPGLEVTSWSAHRNVPGFPRFTVVVYCPGTTISMTISIRNNTSQTIIGEHVQTDDGKIILRTKSSTSPRTKETKVSNQASDNASDLKVLVTNNSGQEPAYEINAAEVRRFMNEQTMSKVTGTNVNNVPVEITWVTKAFLLQRYGDYEGITAEASETSVSLYINIQPDLEPPDDMNVLIIHELLHGARGANQPGIYQLDPQGEENYVFAQDNTLAQKYKIAVKK